MASFATKLRDDIKIELPHSLNLASSLALDIQKIPKIEIDNFISSDFMDLRMRCDELFAFERFQEHSNKIQIDKKIPEISRAQVVTQLYVSFVYLNESCFSRFRKIALDGSLTKKCCKALTDNPIRGIRNAVAHANWHYTDDFNGLAFRYYKDPEKSIIEEYILDQNGLDFWSTLSRLTAYVIFQTTKDLQDD